MKKILFIIYLWLIPIHASDSYGTTLQYSLLYVNISWNDGVGSYIPNTVDLQKMVTKYYVLNQYIEQQFDLAQEDRVFQLSVYLGRHHPYRHYGQITKSPHNYSVCFESDYWDDVTGPSLETLSKLIDYSICDEFRSRMIIYPNTNSVTWVDSLSASQSKILYTPYSLTHIDLEFYSSGAEEYPVNYINDFFEYDTIPNGDLIFKYDTLSVKWNNQILQLLPYGIYPTVIKERLISSDLDSVFVFSSDGQIISSTAVPNYGYFKYKGDIDVEVYSDWVNFNSRRDGCFLSYSYSKNKLYWIKIEVESPVSR